MIFIAFNIFLFSEKKKYLYICPLIEIFVGKNKLARFEENRKLPNVIQPN